MNEFKDYNEITIEGLECRLFVFEVEDSIYKEYDDGVNFYLSGFGLINQKKEIILDAEYENITIEKIDIVEEIKSKFKKDFFKLISGDYYPLKGLISSQGEILLKPIYRDIYFEKDGVGVIVTENAKYGLINDKFEIVFQPIFDLVFTSNNGLSVVSVDRNNPFPMPQNWYGLVSDKGEFILPLEYDNISDYQHLGNTEECQYDSDRYYFYSKNGKTGLFNYKKRKKALSSLMFNGVIFLKKEKIFLLYKNGQFGFANSDGEITIMPELDLYRGVCDKDEKYSTKDSNLLLGLYLFTESYSEKDKKFLKVKKDDKYGFINNKGEYIFFPEYISISTPYSYPENIFKIFKDDYSENGLAIYHEGSVSVVFPQKVKIDTISRVNKNLVQFNNSSLGGGLVTNDGEILLESKNPISFLMKKNKIIKEYG